MAYRRWHERKDMAGGRTSERRWVEKAEKKVGHRSGGGRTARRRAIVAEGGVQ